MNRPSIIRPNDGTLIHWLSEQLLAFERPLAIISDRTVGKLYGQPLCESICRMRGEARLFTSPCGDEQKNLQNYSSLLNSIAPLGWGRRALIVALGGGVVTDLAGFVAATLFRGVDWVAIPSSLMGMVDASMGGKTALNLPAGKNLVGSFHQPISVWILPELLKTLPKREVVTGFAEVIKHAFLADAQHFACLEQSSGKLLALDPVAIDRVLSDSTAIKWRYICEDPHDHGKRQQLNFGHTVGHAVESLMSYRIPHGEAVSIGLAAESRILHSLGLLPNGSMKRLVDCLKQFGLPIFLPPSISIENLLIAMERDKKRADSGVPLVLVDGVGEAIQRAENFLLSVPREEIKRLLQLSLK